MTINKSPLQIHYENILSLQTSVIRWSLNNHYIVSEHLKNITYALANEKFSDFDISYADRHLDELRQENNPDEYALFEQLYIDQKFLNSNIPLSDQDKFSFIERVSKYYRSIDRAPFYNIILNQLNAYLKELISISPDISTQLIYEKYRFKMNSSLLGFDFKTLKQNLPSSEFHILYDTLTSVPCFDINDFSYLQKNDFCTSN